jgi:hypothetical protein
MFVRPAENTVKVATLVNSAHAINADLGQWLECHVTGAHDRLTDVVQAVIAVELDLFGIHICDAFRVVGEAEEVLDLVSKIAER